MATLSVEKRKTVSNGQTKNFVVPTITLDHTPIELAQGQATLSALASSSTIPDQPALLAAPSSPAQVDDEIIDAELVEEPTELQRRAWSCADQYGLDRDRYWDGLLIMVGDDLARLEKGIVMVEQGYLEPIGFNPDNTVGFVKRDQP